MQGPHIHFQAKDCKNSLSCGVEIAFAWHVLLKTLQIPFTLLSAWGEGYLTLQLQKVSDAKTHQKTRAHIYKHKCWKCKETSEASAQVVQIRWLCWLQQSSVSLG